MTSTLHHRMVLMLAAIGLWSAWWVGLESRDWLDSDSWQVTRSTGIAAAPDGIGVRYAYQVDGWPYTGERTHFFFTTPYLDDRRQRWLDANRSLTAVAVFYDPEAPARAVLVPRVQITLALGLAMGGVLLPLLCCGGLCWCLWRRMPLGSG